VNHGIVATAAVEVSDTLTSLVGMVLYW
jgi:hypothetical protein